ncbi:unnamed protein product [Somion occarium]|uniref:ubiquitinyl hydrolase 1 n=2 Tax=Somion occarium TaxID=3059160 RepID=A0ABP1E291_9APHY
MPGVTVLPHSPGFGHHSPSEYVASHLKTPGNRIHVSEMQNGHSIPPRATVSDIKTAAREQALKAGRGASPTNLLKSAKDQIARAQIAENEGDLKESLSSLTKAAALVSIFMDSSEFKQEMSGKKGVLTRELLHFQEHEGMGLRVRTLQLEEKLGMIETEASQRPEIESPVGSASIAERMLKLQSAGLSVEPAGPASKRISRDLHTIPPISPDTYVPAPNRMSLQGLPSPLPTSSSLASPVTTSSKLPSPHTLIPASSFGPPSPSSSTASSPLDLTDFQQAFPSIDELDERVAVPSSSYTPPPHEPSPLHAPTPSFPSPAPAFPIPRPAFPVLPLDHAPRPSSTPIPPTIDTFVSRPASPAGPGRSPLSPSVPRKPSGLGLNHKASRSPLIPSGSLTPSSEKRELPFTTLFPRILHEYKQKPGFKVLLLDIRTRDEFEREHIKADAVVCIEPSILLRDGVSAESIENALVIGPRNESTLFSNRDKFDLVAIYDEESENPSASPAITALQRAIYENAFKKILRNIPMLLVGGLKAWKAEFGSDELVRTGLELTTAGPSTAVSPPVSSPKIDGLGITGMNGNLVSASASISSLNGAAGGNWTRGPVSIAQHARTPAESATSPVPPSSFPEAVSMGRSRSGTESATDSGYKLWLPGAPPPRPRRSPNGDSKENLPVSPPPQDPSKRLSRKPAISRPTSNSVPAYTPSIPEFNTTHHVSASLSHGATPIQYPQFSTRTISPQVSGSNFNVSSSSVNGLVSLPPQASINPSPLSRRRSDYVDQSQEALSGITNRPAIDYPALSVQHILRLPPAAASSSMERQDNRPRVLQHQTGPKPPTIASDYPVTYWADVQIGTSGLRNLGNTCYMNSTIQCLSATVPFARFFTDGRWKSAVNMVNPMGTKGNLANAFASILRDMWQGEMQALSPVTFRRSICTYASHFSGTEQHDCQEFLQFLLDGLHEDLNRVLNKPIINTTPEREGELERLPTPIASEQEWQLYRMRNDSLVVDLFQGQFRNRLECLTCHKTSTTYNSFMYLTLPIPSTRGSSRASLHQCLDAFVREEVMEKSDAWHCPNCKTLRKATKRLSLSRLPPVLLVHLKRFSHKGHFTDKIETFVDFPMKGLDLTNYMPSPLPPGVSPAQPLSPDDPRAQIPPYRYDLYAVTNHFGTLSSGHYTAFISSRGGWLYCDDSRISSADPKDVVGKPAYVLYYKRTKF